MVTINALYIIGMDNRVGSIGPGRVADFKGLEANPLEIESRTIRDFGVWETSLPVRNTLHRLKRSFGETDGFEVRGRHFAS